MLGPQNIIQSIVAWLVSPDFPFLKSPSWISLQMSRKSQKWSSSFITLVDAYLAQSYVTNQISNNRQLNRRQGVSTTAFFLSMAKVWSAPNEVQNKKSTKSTQQEFKEVGQHQSLWLCFSVRFLKAGVSVETTFHFSPSSQFAFQQHRQKPIPTWSATYAWFQVSRGIISSPRKWPSQGIQFAQRYRRSWVSKKANTSQGAFTAGRNERKICLARYFQLNYHKYWFRQKKVEWLHCRTVSRTLHATNFSINT